MFGSVNNYLLNTGWTSTWIKQILPTSAAGNTQFTFKTMPSSYIVDQVQIGFFSLPAQVCSFQTFGYFYCKVQSLSVTKSTGPITSPLILLRGSSVTLNVQPSVKIDDAGTITNRISFCSLGSDIVIYQDGMIVINTTVILTSNKLLLSFTLTPTSPILNPSTLTIGFRDKRDSTSKYIYTSLQFKDGTCTEAELANRAVNFQNLTAISSIQYLQNTGVHSFTYSAAPLPTCNGYKSNLLNSLSYLNGSLVNTDSTLFSQCQSDFYSRVCFYHDKNKKELYYASKFKALSPNDFNQTFTFTVTHQSLNYLGATVSKQSQNSFVFTQTSCDSTIFTSNITYSNVTSQSSEFDLIGSGCTFQPEVVSFMFLDSVSTTQKASDLMSWCGKRQFQLEADEYDPNFQLANLLLSDTLENSFIRLTVDQQSYHATIQFQISDISFVDLSLKFLMHVSLQDYQWVVSGPNKTFPIQIIVPKSNSHCQEQRCVVNTLLPKSENYQMSYSIGLGARYFHLPTYTQDPDCGYPIFMMQVKQTGGIQIQTNTYWTNATTFGINFADLALENQVLEFTFTVTLRDQNLTQNSDFKLKVLLVNVGNRQIVDFDSAPHFLQTPIKSLPIPCLSDNSILQWMYQFYEAIDSQNDEIYFSKLNCPTIPDNLFIYSVSQNILTLTIDYRFPYQPSQTKEECQITLSDGKNQQRTYTMTFTLSCSQNQTRAKKEFLVQPNPMIQGVLKNGTILIEWNVDLVLPDTQNQSSYFTQYQPLLLIITRNSQPGNESAINFTYSVTRYEKRLTELSIIFQEPGSVSNNNIKDGFELFFNDSNCFKTIQNLSLPVNFKLTGLLPYQYSISTINTNNIILARLVQFLLATTFISFTLSFLLKALLNFLLSLIKSISLIIHLFAISLNFPLNLKTFLANLFPLVTFELIPTDSLFDKIFHFNEISDNSPISDQFDLSGYSSPFIVQNLGSLYCLINLGLAAIILSYGVAKWLNASGLQQARFWIENIRQKMLWNGWIAFTYDNFIVISTAALLESNDLRFGQNYSATENFCSVLAILASVYTIVFPVIVTVVYWTSFKQIYYVDHKETSIAQNVFNFQTYLKSLEKNEAKMKSHGILLEGIELRKVGTLVAILTPFLDLMRQLILSVTITRLIRKPTLCVYIFNFNLLFYLMFLLQFRPYKDKWDQVLLFVNEATLLVLNYFLFLFTPFVAQKHHPAIGDTVKIVILVNISLNFLIGGAKSWRKVLWKIKLLYSRFSRTQQKKQANYQFQDKKVMEDQEANLTHRAQNNPARTEKLTWKRLEKQRNTNQNHQNPSAGVKSILKRTANLEQIDQHQQQIPKQKYSGTELFQQPTRYPPENIQSSNNQGSENYKPPTKQSCYIVPESQILTLQASHIIQQDRLDWRKKKSPDEYGILIKTECDL